MNALEKMKMNSSPVFQNAISAYFVGRGVLNFGGFVGFGVFH